MNYFNPCPLPADEAVVTAWDSQLRLIQTPWIEQLLADHGHELFQRFASSYAELTALSRSARRALQRRLAHAENFAVPAEWRRKLAYSVAGAALLIALGQTAGEAGTIKVSTKCTLGNAIIAANHANYYSPPYTLTYYGCKASAGINTIVLAKSTNYTLLYSARITSPIIIQGAKAKKPKKGQLAVPGTGGTLHGPGGASAFSVYSGGTLTLQNVTLSGGSSSYGGVIYNGNGGAVFLINSVVSGGSAVRGGGIYNSGSLTITGSKISGNTADYSGGGIFNVGNLTILNSAIPAINSTVSGNTANSGGGIYNTGSATITGSTISENSAVQHGGGVWNGIGGTFAVTGGTITENNSYSGGGIYNAYSLSVADSSTISNNTAHFGGGLFNAVGTDAEFTASTVSGNHATVFKGALTYYGGIGGGIDNLGGLKVTTSTISGNVAEGKSVYYLVTNNYGGKGGGIYNSGNAYIYSGSSVTANTAAYFGGGFYNYVAAGGTFYAASGTIAGNGNPPVAPNGPDIFP